MKITMEVPDALMCDLRERASTEGVPMRDIVLEGLRRELDRRSAPAARVDFVFPTSAASGDGLAPDIDPSRLAEYAW